MSETTLDTLEAMVRRIRERVPAGVAVTAAAIDDGDDGPDRIVVAASHPESGVLTLMPGVSTDGDVREPDRPGAWSLSECYPGGFGPVGVYRESEVAEAVWQWGWGRGWVPGGWLQEHDLREPWFKWREALDRAEREQEEARRRLAKAEGLVAWLRDTFPRLRSGYTDDHRRGPVGSGEIDLWEDTPF